MPVLTGEVHHTLLRLDFTSFAQRSFHEFNPRTRFWPSWHVEVVAASWRRSAAAGSGG